MPHLNASLPKYSLHKASGQAVVYLDNACHYLGVWESRASREEYIRLTGIWLANGRRLPSAPAAPASPRLTINEVLLQYLPHTESYYVKNGKPTSEVSDIRAAVRPLVELFGTQPADDFGPKSLKLVRERMIQAGWCRNHVNQNIGRVKRFFKWAAENELVRGETFYALAAVSGLRRGRSAARETEPVRPVAETDVQATLKHVSAQVAAMIQLQAITGMRPETVTLMRGCDIDTSGKIWEYRPSTHKTEHHGKSLLVFLGPRAQELIKPYLRPDVSAYLFSPRTAEASRNAQRRLARRSPMTPSQAGRHPLARPKRTPGDRYTVGSYRRAIARACKAAGVPQWSPNRLRHNAATRLRKEFGLEAAQVVLGHATAAVTQIYAERDHARAAQIMGMVG